MGRISSLLLKSIVSLCLCLGAAGALFAQPSLNITITGTLGPNINGGPDPLLLDGQPFTATTSINPVGLPVITGSSFTYSGLTVTIAAGNPPQQLQCTAASSTVTVLNPAVNGVGATLGLSNCNLIFNSTFQSTVAFPPNTLVSPIPLGFSANMVTTNNASSGTYAFAGGAPTTLGISGTTTAVCSNCPAMTLTPPSPLTFSGQSGGVAPPSQNVTVGTGGTILDYALTTSTTSGGNWLSVSPVGGQTGGSFAVTANPSALAPGTYTGSVKVYSAASNSPQTLSVTFNVSAPPFILVPAPSSFTFTSVTGGTTPTQALSVTSSPASSVSYTAAVSTTDGNAWLSVNPTSGTTGGAALTVSADPTKVPTGGTYHGTITLTSSGATNSPLAVPVTFNVTKVATSPPSLSFNTSSGGPNPPSQNLSVTSTGPANISFTASASTTSGGSWLSLNTGSGTTNGSALVVSVNNSSLAAGTYNGSVNITPAGATTPISVPVTVTVSSAPSMVPSPSSLTFSSNAGAVPGAQTLNLTSSGAAISYTVATNTSSGGNWLTVSPGSGTTPGSVQVSINSGVLAGLATGTYSGNVVFTATTSAANSPLSVPVTLTVTAALSPLPTSLTFNYTINGTAPGAQPVAVTSNGAAIAYSAAASTTSGGSWLLVSPGSATTPTGISVSVNPASLAAGQYTGKITLTSTGATNSPVSIPVTLNVSSQPTLTVTPSSLTFNLTSLGSLPPSQNLSISASASAALAFTAAASTTSGGNWLSVSPPSGTTPGSVAVSITLNNLAAGIYNGSIKVTATGASNSPVTIPVQLNVTAAPTISANPGSLSFSYQLLSGTNPPNQTASVTASGGAAIPFTAAASTSSGGNWLSVSPSSGNTPATLTVSVNTAGLAAGVYNGSITLTSAQASNSPQPIPVTFTVTAAPTIQTSSNSITFAFQTGGSNPAPESLTVTSSGAALNFTASASTTSGGNWLSVLPTGGTTPSTLTVSVNATALAVGTYNGSITIMAAGASNSPVTVPVTLTVSAQPSLTTAPSALSFNFTIGGSVPASQSVTVGSTGAALSVSSSTSTPWLNISQTGTTTPVTLNVSVNPASMTAGTYNGTITITAAGASNSPLSYPVTLTVSAQPSLTVGPPSLTFAGQAGGGNPASQTISVSTTSGSPSFTATPSTTSGGNWLAVAPTSGTTPRTLTVTVNTSGLASGTYSGSISISATGAANSPVTVPVTLTLSSNALTTGPASLSFSYQIGSAAPTSQNLSVASSGSSLSITAAPGANWLSVSPTTGNTPATVAVSVITTGLTAGTYNSAITITSAGASNSPLSVPVTFTVTPQAALAVSPATLSFSYQSGGSVPAAQSLALSTNKSTATFSATVATNSGGNWLAVSPASGTTPATLMASLNQAALASLAAGTYTGSVSVSASGFTPQTVSVSLVVTKPKATIVVSGNLTFSLANTAAPGTSIITISASDNSAQPFTAAAGPPAPTWLTLSPASGTTPGKVTLTANATGLAPGTYLTSLTVAVPGTAEGSKVLTVQLTVTGSNLAVTPASLSFTYHPGGTLPATQTLAVAPASGTGTIALTSVTTNVTWLKVSSLASAPGNVQVTLAPGLLTSGSYAGNILLTAVGSPGPSLVVPVTLTVSPTPPLTASPAALAFNYRIGGPAPAPQSFALSTGDAALNFTVTSPGAWLSASPVRGTTPGSVSVAVDPTGLGPGTYGGTIAASAYGAANPISIAVTLTVLSAGQQLAVSPSQISFAVPVGGTAPAQTLSVSSGGTPISFTAAASGAKWLSVTPASGTTPASLSVAVNPAGLLDGTFTGTITVMPAGLESGGQTVTVTLKVGTGISTPTIAGVINAASGAVGTVSPGMVISIFGQGLGPQAGAAFVNPPSGETVATTLDGTQVLFDGVPVPVLYTQDGQVNAIAPFALEGKATTLMEVVYNNVKSAGMTLQVAEADSEPGLFTADGSGKGQGAILNQDYSINGASNPAAAGSAVMLFGTGGGQTIPASIDGQLNPLSADGKLVLPVTVMIGGQAAQVLYSGPAPALVGGVIQINAVIPDGTPAGNVPIVVQIGTATTTQTVTVAVK